jgi:hypothetical protein
MALNSNFTAGQILTAAQQNNFPRGVAGSVLRTAGSFTATTSLADITGMTTTFTAVSGRLYKVSYSAQCRKFTSGFLEFLITDGSNNILYDFFEDQTDQLYLAVSWTGVLSGLSGSTTIKVRAVTSTGTATVFASAGSPSSLIVEDIGLA